MHILVIGSKVNREEIAQKFGVHHTYDSAENVANSKLELAEVIFDFVSASTNTLAAYNQISVPVFLDTTFTSLAAVIHMAKVKKPIIGFCGLPTFLNRELLEVCINNKNDEIALKEACASLNTKYSLVKDQVGFVSPRIICMIINEAYFTIEEGTATRQDIDLAMKLGTNYPFGPFDWATKIGARNVVMLLDAVHLASGEERYKACSLLRTESSSMTKLPSTETLS